MKAHFSIIVFALLALSAVVTGTGKYMDARGLIASDLNNALVCAVTENGRSWVNNDTIRVCKQLNAASSGIAAMMIRDKRFSERLSIRELRNRSYISMAVLPHDAGREAAWCDSMTISGDTMIIYPQTASAEGVKVALRANADCSFATVLSLSDQRLPAALLFAAMLWGVFSMLYMRRNGREILATAYAGGSEMLRYDEKANAFYNSSDELVRFTPMQAELMRMFLNADGHRLSKDEICSALWPGKEDANESLYTLIKRLKLVVGQNTGMKIESERGRAYKLTIED